MARDLDQVKQALASAGPLDGVELLDAVATCCLLMAAADGEVAPAETRRIAAVLIELVGTAENGEVVRGVLDALAREVAKSGVEPQVASLATRLRDPMQRRKALTYAAAVAFADDQLDAAEEGLLRKLATAFEVDGDELDVLLEIFRGH